jgi:prephenate dehydrogenase
MTERTSTTSDPIDPARAAAVARLPSKVAFLGFGLIGGSIALALRQAGYTGSLATWTPSGRGPVLARSRGVVDEIASSPTDALEGAGLVVLAAPPLAIHNALDELAGPLRGALEDGVTITDVGSTKGRIIERAAHLGLPLVGGHPMAGRESSGFEAASADLFLGRPWVVVGDNEPPARNLDVVMTLITAVGARPVHMTASAHDVAVAAISHLPLVVSAAIVEAIALSDDEEMDWPAARELAAGGWRDMTRLANGDPEMGAGILATNAFTTAYHLRLLREVIDAWIERLESRLPIADPEPIRARLEAARDALGERPR